MKQRLQELQEQGRELDRHLQKLEEHRESLKRDDTYARFAYITYEDLEVLNTKYPK